MSFSISSSSSGSASTTGSTSTTATPSVTNFASLEQLLSERTQALVKALRDNPEAVRESQEVGMVVNGLTQITEIEARFPSLLTHPPFIAKQNQ